MLLHFPNFQFVALRLSIDLQIIYMGGINSCMNQEFSDVCLYIVWSEDMYE